MGFEVVPLGSGGVLWGLGVFCGVCGLLIGVWVPFGVWGCHMGSEWVLWGLRGSHWGLGSIWGVGVSYGV